MTDGNLFPEISSDPEVEFDPDALSPDPDTITNPQNPVPDPGTIPAPQNLVSVTVAPEATTQIEQPQPPAPPEVVVETQTPPSSGEPTPLDGSIPPALPPEDFTTAASTPQGKRPSNFWLWAAPVLLLLLALFAVGVRAFIVGGIANVSLDVVRPRSGETVFLNQPVTVVARIRSSNGWSKANFYVNNQLLQSTPGMDANYDQELNFAWTPSSEGATMLRVLVTNKKGDQTATEDVAVMVIKGENGATITPVPAASPTTTLTPTKGPSPTPCTDLFEIIAESGLVQGTKMDVGRPFTKSWTVKNVGSCKWEKYKFVFESGSLLGALTPQPVPITDTGGTATLTLNLMSPSIAGNFIGKWRMQNAKGDIFGPELVYGLVIPSPTPTITPTKTDTPTPRPTNTLRPSITRTATKTFTPTATPVTPTATPVTPTATPVTPTATPVTPTATPVTPTATPVTPTATPVTPTATPVTPTATPVTPTATPVTPTATPVTPTATPVTPTATPVTPAATPVTPTATYTFTPEPPTETLTPTNQMVITEEYTETPGTLLYRNIVVTWTPTPPTETPVP